MFVLFLVPKSLTENCDTILSAMVLWFRMLMTIVRGLIRGRIDPLASHTGGFMAFPLLDAETSTLNAGRYFSFCELAVNEANVRNGFYKVLLKHRAVGLTCNVAAHYIRPVRVFKRFEVSTEVVGWDNQFIYRRFRFSQSGEVKFEALYRILIRKWSGQKVSPLELLAMMGRPEAVSPELPKEVALLNYRADR